MGIKTLDIANVTEPTEVTLMGNPNFVIFDGKKNEQGDPLKIIEIELKITSQICYIKEEADGKSYFVNQSEFSIKDKATGTIHRFMGKPAGLYAARINEGTLIDNTEYDEKGCTFYDLFLIQASTYKSLLSTLSSNTFLGSKYTISLNESKIQLRAHGIGLEYDFNMLDYNSEALSMTITSKTDPISSVSLTVTSSDISKSEIPVEISFTNSATKIKQILKATTNPKEVKNDTFLVPGNRDISVTAENIKACLLRDPLLRSNFYITIPSINTNGEIKNGDTIWIKPKGEGLGYTFNEFVSTHPFVKIKKITKETSYTDSILEDNIDCEIQVDIYKTPSWHARIGEDEDNYIVTQAKTYYGKPIWFDVNSVWNNQLVYSDAFLNAQNKWCNTGTDTSFRFTAKRFDGANYETFFHSDELHILSGYHRNLETNDLSDYIFTPSAGYKYRKVKLLTNMHTLSHIEGQKQYFNFIFNSVRTEDEVKKMGILYRLYTQSGSYLGDAKGAMQDISLFSPVNTLCLDIDEVVALYPKVGIVKAYLCYGKHAVSEPLTFQILPSCLYKVNDFAFLNALGGWSSFNFGGMKQTDFKASSSGYFNTQTPNFTTHSRIESVFSKETTEQFLAQTSPITAEVAEWLKELTSSIAVYELATKRYIIVDEMNVKHNSRDDLFSLQMKYHYSDSYNANMK